MDDNLTMTLSFEDWVNIADLLTAADMYRKRLPSWAVTDGDIETTDRFHAQLTDLRKKRLEDPRILQHLA